MISIKEIIAGQKLDPERVKKIKVKVDISKMDLSKINFPLEKIRNMSAGLNQDQLKKVGIYTENISHRIKGQEPHRAYETCWVEHFGYRDCIDWIYRYCPQCNEVYFKRAVICDFDENHSRSYEYKTTTNYEYGGLI